MSNLPLLLSGIRDNYSRGKMADFLQAKIKADADLSFVSAYFTIYAYHALKAQLDNIASLKFLLGEPQFIHHLDPAKTDKKAFKIEDKGLSVQNRLQQSYIARECANWIQAKVQLKSIKQANLLHGKIYYMSHDGIEEAIVGSSNFTMRGLGLSPDGRHNIELNLEVDSNRDRRDLKVWFDELWHNEQLVEDVTAEVLRYLEQMYQNHDPKFIYYKTLFHLFNKYLQEQQADDFSSGRTQLTDSQIWQALFEFQKDGVRGAINKMRVYNGCIIADSVGLGKTYEALAIIKYFENLNYRVLVLCPKKLRENWTVFQANLNSELNPFPRDRFSYTVLCHTDLSRDSGKSGEIDLSSFNWGAYDLVVIDESHNFRNDTKGKRGEDGQIIRQSRYGRLMQDIIKAGAKTKVLLLSATPVNNDLKDLRNQISFLTGDNDNAYDKTLGIASLKGTLAQAQRVFTEWSKQPRRARATLLEKLGSDFFTLLDALTIARSRKHICRHYPDTVAELGGFPIRVKNISVFPNIDLEGGFMGYDRLNTEIKQYKLSLFNPFSYLLPEHRAAYEARDERIKNFKQSKREEYLIGMMKVNFLKRLESSVYSFTITLQRTIDKIESLEQKLKRFQQVHGDTQFEVELDALDDEELAEVMEVGQKFSYKLEHLDIERWLQDLQLDKQQLSMIHDSAIQVTPPRDAKLADLKRLITAKVNAPTTNKLGQPNRKVVVFTAFADTAGYLYEQLKPWAKTEFGPSFHVAVVMGGAGRNQTTLGKSEFSHILTNFSPIAKNRAKIRSMPQNEEIDLLIATDCISEGQNLQDGDYLINYDIHWNPVRLIQRFGRIDRIGSLNPVVQMVNFWPTEDLNKYINLKNRVEARMALVDITATAADNLLQSDLEMVITAELNYRDQQLLRLKDEVLDLEELNESVTLSEFTLEDFRRDLLDYLDKTKDTLKDTPLGLYAVVPATAAIQPGVIFCLEQKGKTTGNETVNPLQPYFLVYVQSNNIIRLGFMYPKQILDAFRLLCVDKIKPYQELCDWFDMQTNHGRDMSIYNKLLDSAIQSIARTFQRRAAMQLQSGRDGLLLDPRQQINDKTDFELVTWLVIK